MAAGQEQDQVETGLTLSAGCLTSFSFGYGSLNSFLHRKKCFGLAD